MGFARTKREEIHSAPPVASWLRARRSAAAAARPLARRPSGGRRPAGRQAEPQAKLAALDRLGGAADLGPKLFARCWFNRVDLAKGKRQPNEPSGVAL